MIMIDHKPVWVVVADSSACRIYDYNRRQAQLALLKALYHPENKLRDIELTSDKPGKYKSRDTGHGAYSQQSDPKEIKIDDFSREIARELDDGRKHNAYEAVVVILPPRIKGLLSRHISKHVKDLVAHSIEKDVIRLKDRELLTFLDNHIG